MRKYGGTVVHQSHDNDGILEVVEENGVRSLHFGSRPIQSSMSLTNPDYLQSPYARAMMAWNLFLDSCDEALMIGLGGGTLAKHMLLQFPESRIKAIEYRASVARIAHSHFGLPKDQRLKICIGDGGVYIREQAEKAAVQQQYELLLIDAFDHDAMSPSVNSEAFFDACLKLLSQQGLMVINLWGNDKAKFEKTAWYMGRSFDWKILFLPVRKRGNIIGFGFSADMPEFSIRQLRAKAKDLEKCTQIEFPILLKDLIKNNNATLDRVLKK
jgi:spermidine synthase